MHQRQINKVLLRATMVNLAMLTQLHVNAQVSVPLMSVIGQPIQKVSATLGAKDAGAPDKDGPIYSWYFTFRYKGADEGCANVVAKDAHYK